MQAIDPIITAIASFSIFIVGNITGWIARGIFDPKIKNSSPESIVLIIVSVAWMISVLADILMPSYQTPQLIHGLMGAIVGFFYKPILGKKK